MEVRGYPSGSSILVSYAEFARICKDYDNYIYKPKQGIHVEILDGGLSKMIIPNHNIDHYQGYKMKLNPKTKYDKLIRNVAEATIHTVALIFIPGAMAYYGYKFTAKYLKEQKKESVDAKKV